MASPIRRVSARAPSSVVERGDVVIVSRRMSFRSILLSPVSSLISWRIQRSLRSPWNHAVGCFSPGLVASAEWNRGVVVQPLDHAYPLSRYRVAVARPPATVDRSVVAEWWAERARHVGEYDRRSIVLIRIAAALYGHDGIRRVIRGSPGDGSVICSELAAGGWAVGGMPRAPDLFVTPADFADAEALAEAGADVFEVVAEGLP
jgi:hypothetical protein